MSRFVKEWIVTLCEQFVKDENCPRHENSKGLFIVKKNKLIWDNMPPQSRTNDKKLQTLSTSVMKADVFNKKYEPNWENRKKNLTEAEKEDINLSSDGRLQ